MQLTYTQVTAPHDGIVSDDPARLGQQIQAGQTLLTITDLGSADIVANFKETQLAGMQPGCPAVFTVDSYPGTRFQAHVASLSPGTGAIFSLLPPENATGNFTKVVQRVPVKLAIDSRPDPVHPLRLGMSVVVTVDVSGQRP